MRVVTVIGVLLVGGVATVSAQHAHQVEFGAFGSYTRYDKFLQLDNQIGGGGRLGYFLNESFSLELDATVSRPKAQPGVPVVYYSAYASDEEQKAALSVCGDAYLKKPVSAEYLEQTIAGLLRKKGS